MRNYDEIEQFIDYTKEEEWKGYIENQVIPLWNKAWILQEFFDNLKEFNGLNLDSIDEEEKPLFLGGVTPGKENIYVRNSLAKFYSKFFGLRLKDIQSWIFSKQEEIPIEVEAEGTETEFIKFAKDVFSFLDFALQSQQLIIDYVEPTLDYKGLKRDPNKLKEIIKDFFQGILNIAANYNYHTFFLCSINQISRKFMKAAYPMIDEALNFLTSQFGLTELVWNNPLSPDSEVFENYTIYCFPEYNPNNKGKSFGGAICALNDMLWQRLDYPSEPRDTLKMLFNVVPNLKNEFKQRVKSRIVGKYYPWIYYSGITAGEGRSKVTEGNKTIMEMLDEISPYLFLGLARIDYISENSISFTQI